MFALLAALSFMTSAASAQTADSLSLTLDDAITSALRTGDEARAAALRVDVADAQVTVARAAALPQLRINATQTHVMESARAQAVGAVFNQPNTYNTNASFSQPLFQGGRLTAARRAARRVRESARLDESEERAQVTLDVQRAYLQALFTARALEIQTSAYTLAGERVARPSSSSAPVARPDTTCCALAWSRPTSSRQSSRRAATPSSPSSSSSG